MNKERLTMIVLVLVAVFIGLKLYRMATRGNARKAAKVAATMPVYEELNGE